MIVNLQEFLNCFMNMFAFLYCINYTMEKKLTLFKFIISTLLLSIVIFILSMNSDVGNINFFIANFGTPFFCYLFTYYLYKDNRLQSFYYALIFNVILGISTLICAILFSYLRKVNLDIMNEPGFFRTVVPLFASIMSAVVFKILLKYNQIINSAVPHNMSVRFVLMNTLFTFILMGVFYMSHVYTDIFMIYVILILFIIQFILQNFIFVQLSQLYQKNNKLELMELSNSINVKYIKDLEIEQQKLREFKHDIKNHLMVLKEMKMQDKAINYMNKIEKELESSTKLVNTGNFYIDACMNAKIEIYQDIAFEINGAVQNDLSIDEKDICSLFFNLIDNAVEAAKECENPIVQIKVMSNENSLLIHVANSCVEEPDFKSRKGYEHGYGVGIIRNIVEKYEGDILFSFDENMFHVKININL